MLSLQEQAGKYLVAGMAAVWHMANSVGISGEGKIHNLFPSAAANGGLSRFFIHCF